MKSHAKPVFAGDVTVQSKVGGTVAFVITVLRERTRQLSHQSEWRSVLRHSPLPGSSSVHAATDVRQTA